MDALYGGCTNVVQCLEKDGLLAPEWTIDEATDFFWAALSVDTWEALTQECGWSKDQYIARLQMALKRALLKTA